MQPERFDGCPFTSLLTLLICLQFSDNNFGRVDILRDVPYEPEKTREFFMLLSMVNV